MRERWLHAGQHPGFVGFRESKDARHFSRSTPQSFALHWRDVAAPSRRPVRLATGVRWADTVLLGELQGVWVHEVVGDTVIASRRLPLVRSEADIRFRELERREDPSFDADFVITRSVAGRLTGWSAVDTTVWVRAAGEERARLEGVSGLALADGRTFESPISFEYRQQWQLADSLAWAAERDSARARSRRNMPGIVWVARTPLEERLQAGDHAAVDSVLVLWRAAQDPNERMRIAMQLDWYRKPDRYADERMAAIRLELGDSATIISQSLGLPRADHAFDVVEWLDDPGRLWQLGILPAHTYVELANALLRATPIIEPDSTKWPCTPAMCARVIAKLETAREPRLRDAALVGAFARDPARWYDRLIARADSGSRVVSEAIRLAHGIAAGPPLPAGSTDWRAWFAWQGGRLGHASHGDALRMYRARTGEDPTHGLAATWPPAGDSARIVTRTILDWVSALPDPSADEIARMLVGDSDVERRWAGRAVLGLMQRYGTAAPDSLAVPLLETLMQSRSVPGQPSPWPVSDIDIPRYWNAVPEGDGRRFPIFVSTDSLPDGVSVPSVWTRIDRAAWGARSPRESAVLIWTRPVRMWGPIVEMTIGSWARAETPPDVYPQASYNIATLRLVRRGDHWVLVSLSIIAT